MRLVRFDSPLVRAEICSQRSAGLTLPCTRVFPAANVLPQLSFGAVGLFHRGMGPAPPSWGRRRLCMSFNYGSYQDIRRASDALSELAVFSLPVSHPHHLNFSVSLRYFLRVFSFVYRLLAPLKESG